MIRTDFPGIEASPRRSLLFFPFLYHRVLHQTRRGDGSLLKLFAFLHPQGGSSSFRTFEDLATKSAFLRPLQATILDKTSFRKYEGETALRNSSAIRA